MNYSYVLSSKAIEDIEAIWNYTVLNWSLIQANHYYQQLFKAIDSICINPEIGKSLQEVKEHHRSRLVGSHLIIYKVEKGQIFVDRILHQSMDIDGHLT